MLLAFTTHAQLIEIEMSNEINTSIMVYPKLSATRLEVHLMTVILYERYELSRSSKTKQLNLTKLVRNEGNKPINSIVL